MSDQGLGIDRDPTGQVSEVGYSFPNGYKQTVVIIPKGYFDGGNADYLMNLITKCKSKGYLNIILSWEQMQTTRATSFICKLAECRHYLLTVGGDLVIVELHQAQREVIALLGLQQILAVSNTIGDALARMEGNHVD
jgi:hypothetical protein